MGVGAPVLFNVGIMGTASNSAAQVGFVNNNSGTGPAAIFGHLGGITNLRINVNGRVSTNASFGALSNVLDDAGNNLCRGTLQVGASTVLTGGAATAISLPPSTGTLALTSQDPSNLGYSV